MGAPARTRGTPYKRGRSLLPRKHESTKKRWVSFRVFVTRIVLVRRVLVRHRVEQHIDPECVAWSGEAFEVRAAVAFPLERIAEISVMGHDGHHAAVAIGDRTHVWLGAVAATF